MGKKESLNPFDYKNGSAPVSNNPFDYKDKTPIEQDFNIGNVESKIKAEQEFDAQINATMAGIPELNKEEKSYLLKAGKSGQLSPDEFKQAIDVMRGTNMRQQQMIDESGKVIDITPVGQVDLSKGFVDQVNEGVQNMFGATGKALGQGHYYMKPNKNGVLVPVPLAVGERPEAGYTVDSVWGNQVQAEDDSRGTDVAKKIFNVVPAIAQGILALPELTQGLITGKTDSGFKVGQQELESLKFKTASKFDKSVIDTSQVKEFKDLFNAEIYDLSPSTAVNQMVNAGTSILQLLATRGALGFAGTTGKIATAGNYLAGFTTNLAEPLKAADDAGVEGRAKYAVASIYSTLATAVEMKLGIEGKILKQEGNAIKKEMIKKLIKDNVNIVDGKLTKESVDNLFNETLKELPKFYKTFAKNALSEGTEEVVQNMIQNGSQEIHDILMKDDPEGAKYDTKFWSPESLAGYMNSFASGMIGGVGGSTLVKNKQSETAYTAIKDGKEDELKADLASSLKRGKITQDEYDRAVFKVNSYKEYYDATASRPIDDENKRKIFDLTYEKQNIKSSIESLEKNNPSGINDGLINTKKQQLTDLNNQVNEIWAKANPSPNPVAQAKAEVPAWRVSLDDFAKETNNYDKTQTQKLKTKEQILTATGLDESLHKLAEPFKVEFKTSRVPEGADPIKIENGFLYEPYETEKTDTKDSEIKTRQLPTYAFEDKEGGTWLFAVGEQTDNNIPDTSYLVKLNEDGTYSDHEEFHFETPKMNDLTFDNIPNVFTRLGLTPVATAKEAKRYTSVASEEDTNEDVEYEVGPEEQLYSDVYNDVKSGIERGKLTALPNNTLGVIVNGRTIPFADSAATNSRMNKEAMPSGDVEIGIRSVEGIQTKQGEMTGLMVYNVETGEDIGYLRATEKSMGRRKVKKNYGTEQEIDIPTTLTEKGKEVLDKLKAESEGFVEETDKDGNRVYKKDGKTYETISSYLNKDVNYQGKPGLKEAALKVGATIDVILKDFFNGKVKAHSEYADIITEDDYNDIIETLDSVRKHAVKKGYSIITEKVILADDKKKIAGSPNIIMVSKDGDVYVYDTAAVRSTITQKTNSRRNFNDLFTKPTGKNNEFPAKQDKIIAKLEIFKDILESKNIEVEGIGAVPFEVDYTFDSKGNKIKITHVKKVSRYDFMEEGTQPKKKSVSVTAKPSVAPAKTTVRRVTMPIQAKVAPVVEPIPGEEMAVSNLVDKRVEYKGKEGVIKRDEGGKLTFESGDTIVELTTKDVAKEIIPESFAFENGKINIKGELFEYVATNRNNKGEIVSVNLKNGKGKVITKRDSELATVIDRTINKSTVDKAMSSSPEFKKEVKSTINRKFKEEFLGEANRVIDSMPDSVSETFVEMESGVSEKSTEELQLMVLEAAEWASKAKADIKKSKAPDFEKRSTTNMLDKFEKDLNKYYAKLDKQRKSEIAAAAKEKARLDFERAGGKIKKSFSEEELNTLSQGKTIEVTEGMTEEDYIEEVYSNSENPAQIASAYLMEEKASEFGENKKTGTKEDTIYEFFKSGGRLSEKAFDTIYDENLRNKGNIKGINLYVAGPDYKGKRTPEDADILGLTEVDDSITTEDVVNFINEYPNGPSWYAHNIEGSMRSKLAYKFKELTGKVLNPNRARELNNKLIDLESESTKEAQAIAEGLSTKVSESMIPEGKDIITGNDNDVAFQKKKEAKIKANIETIVDTLKKAMPNVKVVYDEKLDAAGKWNRATKTITINPYYAGTDTPIHEYGHVLIDAMGDNRVVKAAIKQLKDTDLWKGTAERYPELNEQQLGYEVLAEAIGIEGAGIFDDQAVKSKFKQYLEYIYDWFKTQLGLNKNVAKSLAKKIIGGVGTKKMDGIGVGEELQKAKKKPMLDEESYYRIAFGEKTGITLDNFKESVNRYEAMAANDSNDKTAARRFEDSKKRLDEFESAYKKYRFDYNKLNKLKAEKGNLDGKSFDELIEIYNAASEFDPLSDNSFLNDVKYRIAYLMAEEQRNFLESKGNKVAPKAFADISNKDVFMKSLAHMTEAFPEMQYLSKAYDAAVQSMNDERRAKQLKLTELAKGVAKEEANTLGLKMKDFFSGKAYEFFKWMDKGGELISTEDAYKLSKAKGDYVKFYRDIKEEYKDLQEETPAGYNENALLMTDKGLAEQRSTNGVISAIQSWLGTNSGMKQVVMNYTHSDKRSELLTLEQIEKNLQKEAEKGAISKIVAGIKSAYYNTHAKKLLNKGVDEEGNDISHLKNQGDYMLNRKGKLVNKFGTKRAEGYDYSKDFHAAMVQYLTDITWTKHMQPLIPLVESVEQFSKATGASKGSAKNLTKWIGDWKKMHLYKEKPTTAFPELETLMRVLRKMTSLTSLAFNVKASVMNTFIGEYNNWKELGAKDVAIGHKRLLASTKSGDKKFSTKAHNILMKYGVVATDYDEVATMKAGQMFTNAAMGMTKLAEYVMQGSMFLGQMTTQEWGDFDAEGNYKGSDPNIKQKIEEYKTRTSNIHGKYSAKDRRNFELYEFGKFVGQFKTWVPDWWKERFGSEYIDQYGKRHKGVYKDFMKYAIMELRKDIIKPEFWTSDKLEYVNARKNLKAAMTFGLLMALQAGSDEDKKKRQKADFLSQAIGNLTFVFDPDQAKYMLKTPFAGMSYANAMLDAMTSLNGKKIKKVIPYNKMADVIDYND